MMLHKARHDLIALWQLKDLNIDKLWLMLSRTQRRHNIVFFLGGMLSKKFHDSANNLQIQMGRLQLILKILLMSIAQWQFYM